jgi:hypothetical protein
MSAYYLHWLQRCRCGKPATVEILGPGNASYGKFCERCAKSHLASLKKSGEFRDSKTAVPVPPTEAA